MQGPIISLTLAYCSGLLFGRGFLYFPHSIGILAAIVVLILFVMTWRERFALSRFLLIKGVTWNERKLNQISRSGRASTWEQERENLN
jgi:hypothetical protein